MPKDKNASLFCANKKNPYIPGVFQLLYMRILGFLSFLGGLVEFLVDSRISKSPDYHELLGLQLSHMPKDKKM